MPITLEQAKVGMSNKIDQTVIEMFQRKSEILNKMVFDDTISPQGGSTLAYTYQMELTPSLAAGRAINSEYVPGEALRTDKTTKLKIFGGSYEIDRVIARTSSARLNEVTYQTEKKVEATINLFHYMLINGNSETNALQFDGLDKLLADTTTEFDGASLDLTTMDEDKGHALISKIDEARAKMIRKPDMIIVNSKTKLKLQEAARRVGYLSLNEGAFGNQAAFYDGIEIYDPGQYWNGSKLVDIVPVTTGASDIYLVCFGQNELVGLSPEGNKLVETHLPDFTLAQAVHKGDVEAVWGLALKNTRAAAVIRDVKVTA